MGGGGLCPKPSSGHIPKTPLRQVYLINIMNITLSYELYQDPYILEIYSSLKERVLNRVMTSNHT
jgi:hypothetical protein